MLRVLARKKILIALACLALVAAATAAIWALQRDEHNRAANERQPGRPPGAVPLSRSNIVVGSARYPEYRDLAQLTRASTLVVRGRVVRILPSRRELPAGFDPRKVPPQLRDVVGIVKTDVVVEVTKTIRGREVRSVRVAHLGGKIGRVKFVMEGEPVSRLGRSYVFFLRRLRRSRYGIVGGAQGRYVIRRGRLALVSDDFAMSPVPRMLRGMSARTFERRFAALLRAKPKGERLGDLPQRQERLDPVPKTDKPPSPPGRPPHP